MFRTVSARLIERFIFNFRLRPDALAQHLPVSYLAPQVFNGWSVVSFCVLKLDRMILSPLPSWLGFPTTSCAYRCGVIDTSGDDSQPSVYITDRNTDLPIISRLGPWVFADTIHTVRPGIEQTGDTFRITVEYLDRQPLFTAEATPAADPSHLGSEVFESIDAFAAFIHGGVSSYTPSIYGDALAKVDLHKEDPTYEPLRASIDVNSLDGVWQDAGIIFDSAVRATGGTYVWTYRGLALLDPQEHLLQPEHPLARTFRGFRRAQPLRRCVPDIAPLPT
jgi:hypothetical protein